MTHARWRRVHTLVAHGQQPMPFQARLHCGIACSLPGLQTTASSALRTTADRHVVLMCPDRAEETCLPAWTSCDVYVSAFVDRLLEVRGRATHHL